MSKKNAKKAAAAPTKPTSPSTSVFHLRETILSRPLKDKKAAAPAKAQPKSHVIQTVFSLPRTLLGKAKGTLHASTMMENFTSTATQEWTGLRSGGLSPQPLGRGKLILLAFLILGGLGIGMIAANQYSGRNQSSSAESLRWNSLFGHRKKELRTSSSQAPRKEEVMVINEVAPPTPAVKKSAVVKKVNVQNVTGAKVAKKKTKSGPNKTLSRDKSKKLKSKVRATSR